MNTSTPMLSAMPHSAELTVNHPMATTEISRRPERSPKRPKISSAIADATRYAVLIHEYQRIPSSSRLIVGNAVTTTV